MHAEHNYVPQSYKCRSLCKATRVSKDPINIDTTAAVENNDCHAFTQMTSYSYSYLFQQYYFIEYTVI